MLLHPFLPAAVSVLLSLRNGLRSPWEGMAPIAPSREAPLAFIGGCLVGTCSSESTSRGEARRCVSMRAEKRLRAPDGGLESLSVKEDSEQDKRFLKKQGVVLLAVVAVVVSVNLFTSIKHTETGLVDTSFFFCVLHSQLGRSSPPALVPESQATQAFSLGHSILPGDLVLP